MILGIDGPSLSLENLGGDGNGASKYVTLSRQREKNAVVLVMVMVVVGRK